MREEGLDRGREVVANFLRSRLNRELVNEWLAVFETYLVDYGGAVESRQVAGLKRTALRSTKVLRACADINRDLQASEKALVFLRVLEFEEAIRGEAQERDPLSRELIDLVSDGFGIREGEKRCYETLVFEADRWPAMTQRYHEAFLIEGSAPTRRRGEGGMEHAIGVFPASGIPGCSAPDGRRCGPAEWGAARFREDPALHAGLDPPSPRRRAPALRGHPAVLHGGGQHPRAYPVHPGSEPLVPIPGQTGFAPVHRHSPVRHARRGHGASGSGKSTLLHVLAGTTTPTFGQVTLDGVPVTEPGANGHIGLVPQEDHLLPELTVEENLWYAAARLAMARQDESVTRDRVDRCHPATRAGSRPQPAGRRCPAQDHQRGTAQTAQHRPRTHSRAQGAPRGRADQWTQQQGFGIADGPAEAMTHTGTLVIAVIHQPSGDIFRSFDALWVLDQGGYPVYTGRPLDALTHFRTIVNHFDADQVACGLCGHVNPEQIFDIIEVPVLDGRGKPTGQRRISPKEWNDFHNVLVVPGLETAPDSSEAAQEAEPAGRNTPGWLTQWSIQAARDLNRKLKNRQYLLINLLEAPILAILLAVLLRATERGGAYSFGASQNIPHFLFVSVIVAIFMGLTVSAEELFRDRLMRKREANLHLDWSAYLTAKCAVLFGISAIQTTLFALFATLILQLPGHFLAYTFTLFSVAACANLFGLIASLLFNSVRVIYLAIPLFIIPQLMLGGAIVPFSTMHPSIAKTTGVPWPAQTVMSRWGFEALTTLYAADNAFAAPLYPAERNMAQAEFPARPLESGDEATTPEGGSDDQDAVKTVAQGLSTAGLTVDVTFEDGLNAEEVRAIGAALDQHRDGQRTAWRTAKAQRDERLKELGWDQPDQAKAIKEDQFNQVLLDWTTGADLLATGVAIEDHNIINTVDALYARPHWPGSGPFKYCTSLGGKDRPKAGRQLGSALGRHLHDDVGVVFVKRIRPQVDLDEFEGRPTMWS